MAEEEKNQIELVENIESLVYTIRGVQVMLDTDLARLYGYEVKRLNEQVKRNIERFPDDFMFQLTKTETEDLRSQFATANLNSNSDFNRMEFQTVRSEPDRFIMTPSVLNLTKL